METIQESEEFKNFEEMCRNSEAFKRGVKAYKEGKGKTIGSVEPVWVSQVVKVKEWNNYFKYNKAYFYLEKVSDGVKIAFLVAGLVPMNCELLTDEELRILDVYRRSNHIYPTPLK